MIERLNEVFIWSSEQKTCVAADLWGKQFIGIFAIGTKTAHRSVAVD